MPGSFVEAARDSEFISSGSLAPVLVRLAVVHFPLSARPNNAAKNHTLKEGEKTMPIHTSMITVKVKDASSRDRQLEQVSSLLREKATDCGILVIRMDFTTFSITLSPDIPFGFTMERDLL